MLSVFCFCVDWMAVLAEMAALAEMAVLAELVSWADLLVMAAWICLGPY